MAETQKKSFHGGLAYLMRDKTALSKQEKARATSPRTERKTDDK